MTNSRPPDGPWLERHPATEAVLSLAVPFAFAALFIILWQWTIPANALVLTALGSGWGVAAWYAYRVRQDRARRDRDRIDEQQYERDRALRLALHAPADTLIGDTERDAVREVLGDAVHRGRISLVEHMDRLDAVNDARTPADLRDALKGLL